jgi:5-methylcytosine-specific restriction endonuclease McrA
LNGYRGTLYLHVSLADLAVDAGGGRVERLGTASLALLRAWLQRMAGVTIRPVADLTRIDAVDAHDPPAWMREVVILRDQHCVFPGCTIDARACDLDHLQPYVPLDQGGPPGQTRPANLVCLCRRHHRAKTFAGWRYRRVPDPPDEAGDPGAGTTYERTSPPPHLPRHHPLSRGPTPIRR